LQYSQQQPSQLSAGLLISLLKSTGNSPFPHKATRQKIFLILRLLWILTIAALAMRLNTRTGKLHGTANLWGRELQDSFIRRG
jgi:hypothetical protein